MEIIPTPQTCHNPNPEVTGCRFSLSAMCDDYINVILDAAQATVTEHVWSRTDALSTIYRGCRPYVVDAVRRFFTHANDGKTHITMEASFSNGSLGDIDAAHTPAPENAPLSPQGTGFPALCKIAFYPLGVSDYMRHIAHVVNLAIESGLYRCSSHYATELQGNVHDLFDYFNGVLAYGERELSHYVLQVTLSVNSPSKQ